MVTTEPMAIARMGTAIGRNDRDLLGSLPYDSRSVSCSASTSSAVRCTSSGVVTRFVSQLAMKYATTRAGTDTMKPMPMTRMRLSAMPSVVAAAIGPGVGGIKTCEMYRPEASATVMAADALAVRRTKARRIGLRTTNPESQNTAMDTTNPMSWVASTGWRLPTVLTMADRKSTR